MGSEDILNKDLYKILNIEKNATSREIKLAYRHLMRIYHPDVNEDADSKKKFNEMISKCNSADDFEKDAKAWIDKNMADNREFTEAPSDPGKYEASITLKVTVKKMDGGTETKEYKAILPYEIAKRVIPGKDEKGEDIPKEKFYEMPKNILGLIYTGEEQELLLGGEIKAEGKPFLTMEYKFADEDDNQWKDYAESKPEQHNKHRKL